MHKRVWVDKRVGTYSICTCIYYHSAMYNAYCVLQQKNNAGDEKNNNNKEKKSFVSWKM